jgi:protein-tyrosine phosphatase
LLTEVIKGIFVGDDSTCCKGTEKLAVVHACKLPCHSKAVNGKFLDRADPNYLSVRDPFNLYLNIVDPAIPLFFIETFKIALSFMKEQWAAKRPILIHCNGGWSRSPSLALLFLAKITKTLPDHSYLSASRPFLLLYPRFSPGAGIKKFLETHWQELGA